MHAILGIATAFAPVIIALNMLGGIMAGIWLAIEGDWWALGYGLLAIVVGHWIISLLLIPFFLLAFPGIKLFERGQALIGRLVYAVASLYMLVVMFMWSTAVTATFATHSREAGLFPVLLWSYGVVTGPWTYLASKDQQGGSSNEFSVIAALFLQIGYILGATMFLFNADQPGAFGLTLLAVLVLHWLVQQGFVRELFAAERGKESMSHLHSV